MASTMKRVFDHGSGELRARLILVYSVLFLLNAGSWLWALLGFRDHPAMLGVALLVYGLGLRHAVDIDHIAAIDNVTRKLMLAGQRPVTVGFFFALGHSTVVVIACAGVAIAASILGTFETFREVGGLIGTLVSAFFLFGIAAMNMVILAALHRSWRRIRAGGSVETQDLDLLLNNRGLLTRLFRPVFRLVTKSWHMFPLGFLFGLGFDTATEVAVFGVSAAQAAKGISLEAILVFPALFAAGMSLVDTTDGVVMLGAYQWAFVKPLRKLHYNMTITIVSIAVAVLIGGIEMLGLIGDRLALSGGFWNTVGTLNDNFNNLGFIIIGIYIAAWAISYGVWKARGLDKKGTSQSATAL